MIHKSLFLSSVSFAFNNMRKNFLKLFRAILIALFSVGIGIFVVILVGLTLYKLFFAETLINLMGLELATKFINSVARPVSLVLASILFLILALYILYCIVKAFLRCLSVFLSVARGEKDILKCNRTMILQALILFTISVMLSALLELVAESVISVSKYRWLGRFLVYLIMIRFQYSWLILIEQSVSAYKAMKLSWTLTSGHMIEICKIVLVYNLMPILMMIISWCDDQLHWSFWLALIIFNIIFYLPFSMLVLARSYVLLDEK